VLTHAAWGRARLRLVGSLVALVAGLVVGGTLTPAARADGDPASDVLLSQTLFLPHDAGLSATQQAALSALLAAAKRGGLPVRVAVIPNSYDLGSVLALWQKPSTYARFLGIELSLVYKQALLVVMPNGVGLNWPGHSTASADRLLASISPGRGAEGLLAGTEAAVRAVAAASGLRIAQPGSTARPGGDGVPVGVLAGVVAALLAGVVTLRVLLGRRRRATPDRPPQVSTPAPVPVGDISATAPVRTRSIRLRWAVPGLVGLCCVAVGTPILIVSLVRHTPTASGTVAPSAAAPSAFTWRAGKRLAPAFSLIDQGGRPVSMSAYRGRPVIVTFIDPLCRNLCPLAAQVLDEVDRQLPPSERLPILAVSVDTWADTHANLMLDYREWRLVPQWRWAVGSPNQLANVWKRWGVGVSVSTKRIAGTAIHIITHDEFAFLVDPDGYERALFVWPYGARDVEAELHRLAVS